MVVKGIMAGKSKVTGFTVDGGKKTS